MHGVRARNRQRGAFIITTALLLLLLLGFMGIAIDFGRLFVVKTELQTAMDSCALAAAQELDAQPTALDRARNAGRTAGNLNRVNMQSANWSGQGQIDINADITFRDAAYDVTAIPASARYAQCQHTQSNLAILLMQIIGLVNGDTAGNPATRSVWASAVATRASSQTSCPIPLKLIPKPGHETDRPNYGFTVGEWITVVHGQNEAQGGQIGWANLIQPPENGASETEAELNGYCGSQVSNTLGNPGVRTTIVDVWNGRFGIYKNNSSPSQNNPDFTGYAYTAANWPAQSNAYDGVPGPGAHPTAQNFVTKRATFASCADTGISVKDGPNSCSGITGISLNGGFQNPLAAPGNGVGGHKDFGRNRRIVVVPVANGDTLVDFACVLMLEPLSIPMSPAKLEFRGNAAAAGSPCTTSGLPGGAAGPLVPVLVR